MAGRMAAALQPMKRWFIRWFGVDSYVRWKGNAAAAWRERRGEDEGVPALRTFQTALAEGLSPGDRAAIRDGVEGRRSKIEGCSVELYSGERFLVVTGQVVRP